MIDAFCHILPPKYEETRAAGLAVRFQNDPSGMHGHAAGYDRS